MASSQSKPTIGFVGLGAMGFGMATNLVKQGYPVKGYDVFPKSVERFKDAGGLPASTLEESAQGNLYYVCMVASEPQAQSVLFDSERPIADVLPKGATLFLCSTVSSVYAQSVSAQLKSRGRDDILFVDCPVSGGAKRAADGTLSIMAGGSDEAMQAGQFLLAEMADSAKLYLVPGGVGAGSNMKMVHQVLAGIHILGVSEAMGFAARLGLNAAEAREAVINSDAWSWMFENRSPRILEEDYFPGVSALTIILKDVGIITSSARLFNFPIPLVSAAEQTYVSALSRGFGPNDDAGMVRMYYQEPVSKITSKLSPEETASRMKLVTDLLTNVHVCGAAEAVAFAKHLKVDLPQFYELVNNAAGGSRMFESRAKDMMSGLREEAKGGRTVHNAAQELSAVVQEARRVECPVYLASEALNIFLLARRKGMGGAADSNVIRVWEDCPK